MKPCLKQDKYSDYPEETEGTRIAREVREKCNTLSNEERQRLLNLGIDKIYHFEGAHKIINALKEYILTRDELYNYPDTYSSFRSNDLEYLKLLEAYKKATRNLWEITDIEYDEDGFRNLIWNWRYWKVMARKCTFLIKTTGNADQATKIMKELETAENELFNACGLIHFSQK